MSAEPGEYEVELRPGGHDSDLRKMFPSLDHFEPIHVETEVQRKARARMVDRYGGEY